MRTSSLLSGIVILALLPLAASPADTDARKSGDLLRRGAALMRAGRSVEAEAILTSLAGGDAEYPSAQTLLGYGYLRRSALDLAGKSFRSALQRFRHRPRAFWEPFARDTQDGQRVSQEVGNHDKTACSAECGKFSSP